MADFLDPPAFDWTKSDTKAAEAARDFSEAVNVPGGFPPNALIEGELRLFLEVDLPDIAKIYIEHDGETYDPYVVGTLFLTPERRYRFKSPQEAILKARELAWELMGR